MPAIINTNISSLTAQRNLTGSQASLASSIQRLSSGLRINSAKDDAAGLAIANRFTSQINGLSQAVRNANDGVSLAQTAEGALGQVGDALQRIRELAVQSANATNSASDRAALQQEVSQLIGEIGRIGNTTNFNGLKILDGSYTAQQFQVGANAGETLSASISDSRSQSLGADTLSSGSGVITSGSASTASLTGSFKINGVSIDTSAATNLTDVVAAINAQSGSTGVSAARSTSNVNSFTYTSDATNNNTIKINGVSVSIAAGSSVSSAAAAINAVSNQTGVTASGSGSGLTLTSANGADLQLADDAANGVLTNYNGTTTAKGKSATLSAGLLLSAKIGGALSITEGSGSTAKDLQILLGLQVGATSTTNGSVFGGPASLSYTTINGSVFNSTATLDHVIIGSGNVFNSSVTITNSIVQDAGNVFNSSLTATNSIISGGGSNVYVGAVTNNSPASGGSSKPPSLKTYQVSTLDVSTVSGANDALNTVDFALQQVSGQRAALGALQNRFTAVVASLSTASENLSASRSRIQDADFASETAQLTRSQVLQQAGTAVLAQANAIPNGVLSLLR